MQTHLDNDGDGLTIGVIFNGDKNRYAFSPGELTVVTDQATLEAHWRQLGGTLRGTWPHEFGPPPRDLGFGVQWSAPGRGPLAGFCQPAIKYVTRINTLTCVFCGLDRRKGTII